MHDKVNASQPDSTLLVIERVRLETMNQKLVEMRKYFRKSCNCRACNLLQDIENTLQSLLLNK